MQDNVADHTKQTAHTLFLDFVGYSRLTEAGQVAVQRELADMVASTRSVKRHRNSDQMAARRTGDGMMLAFLSSVDDAVDCAVELDSQIRQRAAALREIVGAPFRLRMGIHSGPVVRFVDSESTDLAGDGVNLAQRVMDAGDDGHILLSQQSAESLLGRAPWNQWLRDLGPCRVKHDELVHLWNLAGVRPDGLPLGNEAVPRTVFASQEQARRLLQRDEQRDRESNREWGTGVLVRVAVVSAAIGALVLTGVALTRKAPGAAQDLTRFTQRVEDAARTKRKQAEAIPESNAVEGIPVAAPAEAAHRVDANVPDLTGLSTSAARQQVEALGLALRVDALQPTLARDGVRERCVSRQDPPPGRSMVANGVVFVSVAPADETGAQPKP
jgi:class 3 adenylate cyclase